MYNTSSKIPLNVSPALPYFQQQFEESGQVSNQGIKLSDFGIFGLHNDVAVMTDCQYGGRTKHNASCDNLSCATHFDFTVCISLHSGHLEQLAIAYPNLQRLSLQKYIHSLKVLQGLKAVASHCHNLQGLNLLSINVSQLEDHILKTYIVNS